MRLAGVVGYPVAHSLSPNIHRYWLRQCGIADADYEKIEILPDQFEQGINALIEKSYAGFNVTVPYKERIMKLCDEVDEIATQIGAVNTVVIKDGKLLGTNSDAFGFIANLKSHIPTFDFGAAPALLLGAGGAAKAIIYGLLQEGVPQIRITNRTQERAEELAQKFGDRLVVIPWEKRQSVLEDTNLLVNSTTLGMEGFPELEIDITSLPSQALVTDIVYKPLRTKLLRLAEERGNLNVDGLGMLLYQAMKGFRLWFGGEPEVTEELRVMVLGK